jgi:hypothetical protein
MDGVGTSPVSGGGATPRFVFAGAAEPGVSFEAWS